MAQVVRRLVSGQKKRFSDYGFDLDLAYITPRLVAMGLPATGSEGLYRNPLAETARFLSHFHRGRCKVWNLCSERLYDPAKMGAPVVQGRFAFDDHQVPPLLMVHLFCSEATEWLAAHPENVCIVHCKAGKGRTGLMLCCLMLHLHLHDHRLANFPPEALESRAAALAARGVPRDSREERGVDGGGGGGGGGGSSGGGGSAGLWWRRQLQQRLPVDLSSLADPVEDALSLYADRRTHDGKGVTIGSQRRWVAYFWRALKCGGGAAPPPRPVRVRRIRILGLPPGAAASCSVTVAQRPEWLPPPAGAAPPPPRNRFAAAAAVTEGGGGVDGWGIGGGGSGGDVSTGGTSGDGQVSVQPDAGVRPRTVAVYSAPGAGAGAGCMVPCGTPPAVHCGEWPEEEGATVSVRASGGDGDGPASEELEVKLPPGSMQLVTAPRLSSAAGLGRGSAGDGDGFAFAAPAGQDGGGGRGGYGAAGGLVLMGDVKIHVDKGSGSSNRLFYTWFSTAFLPAPPSPGGRAVHIVPRRDLDKLPRSAPQGVRLEVEYEEPGPPRGGTGDEGGEAREEKGPEGVRPGMNGSGGGSPRQGWPEGRSGVKDGEEGAAPGRGSTHATEHGSGSRHQPQNDDPKSTHPQQQHYRNHSRQPHPQQQPHQDKNPSHPPSSPLQQLQRPQHTGKTTTLPPPPPPLPPPPPPRAASNPALKSGAPPSAAAAAAAAALRRRPAPQGASCVIELRSIKVHSQPNQQGQQGAASIVAQEQAASRQPPASWRDPPRRSPAQPGSVTAAQEAAVGAPADSDEAGCDELQRLLASLDLSAPPRPLPRVGSAGGGWGGGLGLGGLGGATGVGGRAWRSAAPSPAPQQQQQASWWGGGGGRARFPPQRVMVASAPGSPERGSPPHLAAISAPNSPPALCMPLARPPEDVPPRQAAAPTELDAGARRPPGPYSAERPPAPAPGTGAGAAAGAGAGAGAGAVAGAAGAPSAPGDDDVTPLLDFGLDLGHVRREIARWQKHSSGEAGGIGPDPLAAAAAPGTPWAGAGGAGAGGIPGAAPAGRQQSGGCSASAAAEGGGQLWQLFDSAWETGRWA